MPAFLTDGDLEKIRDHYSRNSGEAYPIILLHEIDRLREKLINCHPHYTSTYCIHEDHENCRLVCKTCEEPCLCDCHDKEKMKGPQRSHPNAGGPLSGWPRRSHPRAS
jgi:hypothetical protein